MPQVWHDGTSERGVRDMDLEDTVVRNDGPREEKGCLELMWYIMSIKSFPVSHGLRVEAVMGDTRPNLIVHQGIAPGFPPYYVIVRMDEVRKLVAQLIEASIYLVSEEANG